MSHESVAEQVLAEVQQAHPETAEATQAEAPEPAPKCRPWQTPWQPMGQR
jgi:hypothetical protein